MIRRLYGVDPEVAEIDPGDITGGRPALGSDFGPTLPLSPGTYNWIVVATGGFVPLENHEDGGPTGVIGGGGGLVVGLTASHITLSGGGPVAGAGKFRINPHGEIDWVGLNHSGHYHPPLTAQYARFVYDTLNQAALFGLLTLSHAARYEGRVKDGDAWFLVKLDATDLSRDSDRLAWLIAGDVG